MEINIISQISECQEFIPEPGSPKETVSIVISPLKVNNDGDSNIRVVSGCNMWQACQNQRCHFSVAARKLPKIKKLGD